MQCIVLKLLLVRLDMIYCRRALPVSRLLESCVCHINLANSWRKLVRMKVSYYLDRAFSQAHVS
jgi:hypothetical protein